MTGGPLRYKSLIQLGDPTYEDMHVHSVFSDGTTTVEENLRTASERGLRRLLCVDHVRRDTSWLPTFVAEVATVRTRYPSLEVLVGVEAKILDAKGTLDLPDVLDGVDFVQAADHQVPCGDTCASPRAMAARLKDNETTPEAIVSDVLASMHGVMDRYINVIFSHPFSALPKMGLSEELLRDEDLVRLAEHSQRAGALFEVSESWRCPSARVVRLLRSAGARFVVSTDSHASEGIGRYEAFCVPLLRQIGTLNGG